jgi:heat shock protein HtpX
VPVKSANQSSAPMYIINPFRKKGRAASDLSSTHPPISERVRILRSMAGGASLADYDNAFRQVHKGGGGVIPPSAIAGAGAVDLRTAVPEDAQRESKLGKVERTREVSDLMWRLNNYETITCACGTKLKIPPKLKSTNVKCPHCGRDNRV